MSFTRMRVWRSLVTDMMAIAYDSSPLNHANSRGAMHRTFKRGVRGGREGSTKSIGHDLAPRPPRTPRLNHRPALCFLCLFATLCGQTVPGMILDLAAIREAHERIRPFIKRTPVLTSDRLDAAAAGHLFFKCENFQEAGAFKSRGACNAVFSLTDAEAATGVRSE